MFKLKVTLVILLIIGCFIGGYFAFKVRRHGSRIGEVRKFSYGDIDFSKMAFRSWEGELAQSGGHLGLSDAENGNIWHFAAGNDPMVCAKIKHAMRTKKIYELRYVDYRFYLGYSSNYVITDVFHLNSETGLNSEIILTEDEIKHALD
jgi:hypothetical protein